MELSVEQCGVAAQVLATVMVAMAISSNLNQIRDKRLKERFSWLTYDAHSMTVQMLMGLASLLVLVRGVFGDGLSGFFAHLGVVGTFATLLLFIGQVVKALYKRPPHGFDQNDDNT